MAIVDENGKKMKYPRSVFFIILNEFCERFSYYGMRTALSLYFVDVLLYEKNTATVMYHTFTMLAYFFPLFGAMLADSWLNKYRTILYLSVVYAVGQLLLSASSVPTFHLPVRAMSILGLVLIALGTGGIKPCVAAFGGDQFKLPQQELYLSTFFSLFYFSINSGSLISTFITPILRKDITCYGQNACYPLAFLVPSILMIVSVVIFFAGRKLYKVKEPEGNVVFNVAKCVCYAVGRKIKSKEEREHWLDYADDKYEHQVIEDIKSTLKVLKLFIPLPIFWALFDQQGSRWTFQATRMDGVIFGYLIKPDQFQVVNPLFIVLFIPIFQWVIYPLIERFLFINTPLRKLTVGGLLAALSFVISGLVEFKLETTYAVQPYDGIAHLRVFNTVPCNVSFTIDDQLVSLGGLDIYQNLSIPAKGDLRMPYRAEYKDCQYTSPATKTFSGNIMVSENEAISYAITKNGISKPMTDKVDKSETGDPIVRGLVYREDSSTSLVAIKLDSFKDHYQLNATKELDFTNSTEVNHNSYKVTMDGQVLKEEMFMRYGGVYTVVGYMNDNTKLLRQVTVVEPNSVHMFWLFPQYIVITMGEIMFSITGLEFAFTQAPTTMKSLLQASWLMTVAIGNLVVVIIAELQFFKRQVFEFFLFAALMVVDMMVFAVMARFYKYVEVSTNDNSTNDDEDIHLETKQGIGNASYSEDL